LAAAISPFVAGLKCRCPKCGEGAVFQGYLRFRRSCEACGADFTMEDAGDGPAVFVIFLVGAIVVPLGLVMEGLFAPPMWVHMMVLLPLTLGLCLALLPPFKATMFALQWNTKAREERFRD
jgi:uncharacterized protein (DUF983 family)